MLGIRYLVENNYPDCTDLKCSDSFQASFLENFSFSKVSCSTFYYSCSLYKNPTRDFYTLELIGNVNPNEPKYINWIKEALQNSWKKEYSNFNIAIEKFNAKQDLRIGSLGTETTKIYYTVTLNSKTYSKYEFPSPSSERIEQELKNLGSDLRIYPEPNSISKKALASIYARVYPLNPGLRLEIEKKIKKYYKHSNSDNPTNILFWELYSGDFRQDLTRLYYTVNKLKFINFLLIFFSIQVL